MLSLCLRILIGTQGAWGGGLRLSGTQGQGGASGKVPGGLRGTGVQASYYNSHEGCNGALG